MFAFKKAERYSVCNSARATFRDFGAFWACQVCAAPFPLAEGKNSCQPGLPARSASALTRTFRCHSQNSSDELYPSFGFQLISLRAHSAPLARLVVRNDHVGEHGEHVHGDARDGPRSPIGRAIASRDGPRGIVVVAV